MVVSQVKYFAFKRRRRRRRRIHVTASSS